MARQRLSVTIITLDEEANLRRCLESVRIADEIVVVDSGSTDQTCEIAREYTGKVFFREMQGFGAQKQYAVDQTEGDWILSLDADEWVSDELRLALVSFLETGEVAPPYDGYRIYRRNIFLGRPMRYCGWYQPILRLFRRGKGRFNDKLVHEGVLVNGPAGLLSGDILHVPYRDPSHHMQKMLYYARLDAQELIRKGRMVYGWQAPVHLVLRPLWKFAEKYVWQQGFREGIHGLILSGMAAVSVFLVYLHCWQLQRTERQGDRDPPEGAGSF